MARIINTFEFQDEVLNKSGIVIVDFFATWCSSCKTLDPILDEISVYLKGKAKVLKLDVNKSPEIAQKYKVSGVPIMIFFRDGKAIDKIVGFQPKSVLRSKLQNLL
ncbi:thioredoxin [Clostridium pasteurianum]|uniref:thioredoxin n=1 Tax=Clostridium pasteurianum TaxID=1501 RepID=UPI00226095F4|nr:thioredoxin [Clostridium pasteurianum]UZW16231.1 thioredoxin [Clostridium pasteurianum]